MISTNGNEKGIGMFSIMLAIAILVPLSSMTLGRMLPRRRHGGHAALGKALSSLVEIAAIIAMSRADDDADGAHTE